MQAAFLLLLANAALGVFVCGDTAGDMVRTGTMRDSGGMLPVAATLTIDCLPGDNGTVRVDLMVPRGDQRESFDYRNFAQAESANQKPLTRLTWTAGDHVVAVTEAADGRFDVRNANAFVFSIRQPADPQASTARLLETAMQGTPGTFEWTQTAADDPRQQLVATFEFDWSAVQLLTQRALACVLPSSGREK
jgi:hypothetical protein